MGPREGRGGVGEGGGGRSGAGGDGRGGAAFVVEEEGEEETEVGVGRGGGREGGGGADSCRRHPPPNKTLKRLPENEPTVDVYMGLQHKRTSNLNEAIGYVFDMVYYQLIEDE